MADLLTLTGDVVGLGDSDIEDFHTFAPDTPHVMLQIADGRSLMVLGITRDEARKLGIGFSEPLTLSLSTAALASPPVAVQEERDAKDAARWRRLVNASEMPFPILALADDPENDCLMVYGRKRLEERVDEYDLIPDTYDAMKGDQP